MRALRFATHMPVLDSAPGRLDVACFIGYVARRDPARYPVPAPIVDWLGARNYPADPALRDVPVPIDTWESFDALFAWEQRPLGVADAVVPTYLGTSIRSFFAQGGRKCYVVRVGEPWPVTAVADVGAARDVQMAARLAALLPGYPASLAIDPLNQAEWSGVSHLLGLPDVSFVSLPDLADIVRAPRNRVLPPTPLPRAPEVFVVCSDDEPAVPHHAVQAFTAPTCDDPGYAVWSEAVRSVGQWLHNHRRTTQLVAAVPLPARELMRRDLLTYLLDGGRGPLALHPNAGRTGVATSFVQLVYPWLRTAGSAGLPARLEPPDGTVIGLLADNALAQGTFRTAAGRPVADVYGAWPPLLPEETGLFAADATLVQRVSLVGREPDGWRLLSDVTASADVPHRPGNVHRLISVLLRAASNLGETLVFAVAGEALWAEIRRQMNALLQTLWQMGALRGDSAAEAYSVRCDRSTMAQNDIDNGRAIVEVRVQPAAPVTAITVVLAVAEGSSAALVGLR